MQNIVKPFSYTSLACPEKKSSYCLARDYVFFVHFIKSPNSFHRNVIGFCCSRSKYYFFLVCSDQICYLLQSNKFHIFTKPIFFYFINIFLNITNFASMFHSSFRLPAIHVGPGMRISVKGCHVRQHFIDYSRILEK